MNSSLGCPEHPRRSLRTISCVDFSPYRPARAPDCPNGIGKRKIAGLLLPVDRVSVRLQTRGALFCGGALALLAAGLWRVDGVMASMGLAGLLLAILVGLVARRNLSGLAVRVDGPRAGRIGEPAKWRLTLCNARRVLDAFGVEIAFSEDTETTRHALWVAAGSAAEAEFRRVPRLRGKWDGIGVALISEFPLGFFRAHRAVWVPHRWHVAPKPLVPVELLAEGGWLEDAPRPGGAVAGPGGELRGMRPYRSGDSPKMIVWPATLRSTGRGGGLLVMESDPPGFRPSEVVVVFHSFGTDRELIRPDRFERALALASGTLWHFLAMGVPVRFVADFDGWIPRPASSRRHLAVCEELMAEARRMRGTEGHDLGAFLESVDEGVAVVVVSDMPANAWAPAIRSRRSRVAVDVRRYERGRNRR